MTPELSVVTTDVGNEIAPFVTDAKEMINNDASEDQTVKKRNTPAFENSFTPNVALSWDNVQMIITAILIFQKDILSPTDDDGDGT